MIKDDRILPNPTKTDLKGQKPLEPNITKKQQIRHLTETTKIKRNLKWTETIKLEQTWPKVTIKNQKQHELYKETLIGVMTGASFPPNIFQISQF